MKKFLAIAISAIFLLGFAASAFAIHAEIPAETQAVVAKGTTQIMIGGSVRVRGFIEDTDFNDSDNDSKSAWDQRVRLHVDAKVADNVQGYIELESRSGENDTAENWTWGEDDSGATGLYGGTVCSDDNGCGNARRADMSILQAWINYTNDIVNVKVGHMPLALGSGMFFNHTKFGDDALILYKDVDNLHLAALTAKFDEGSSSNADDGDAYVALFAYKGEGYNVSGDITWVDDNSFAGNDTDLYNFALRGDVDISDMINVYGDVEFQTGELNATTDFGGYAFKVGANFDVQDVAVNIEGGMGSGDDNAADGDLDAFVTSLGAHLNEPGTYVYDYRAANVCRLSPAGTAAGTRAGVCNLTWVKAQATTDLTDKLKGNVRLYWLMASEDVLNAAGALEDSIGVEVDGKFTYKLARNLKYWVEGGYLFAGDVYNGLDAAGTSADDAYSIRHGIQVAF